MEYMYLMNKLIPISPDFSQNSLSNVVKPENDINTYFFVNKNVRGISLLFNLYFPNDDNWMNCLIVI